MTHPLPGLPLPVPELLVVLGSAALLVSGRLPSGVRRRARLAAVALVTVGLALVLSTSALRWPLLPVLAADLLAGAAAGAGWLRGRRSGAPDPRRRRWPALLGSLVCLGLVAAGGVAAWALPVPTFPRPSGESPVGTTVVQWADPGREETATPEVDDRRTVVVQLWYPAQPSTPGTPRAQYLGRTPHEAATVAGAAADYLGVPGLLLDGPPHARSHATPDAAPAAGRVPVVLFSPGLGGLRTQSTAWAEDLASRGYLVAGVDHPYDSAAVVLADGRVARTQVAASGDAREDARRRIGWTTVRAADLGFVLTQLGRLDRGELASPFEGLLDTGRAAVTGHSVGGAAAVRAAAQDPRFTAVINVDGGLDADQGPLQQPVLALTHEVRDQADADYVARLSSMLAGGTGGGYLLTVPGSAHLTFTDAPLYLPPVPAVIGSLGRAESVRTTAATCAAFLDATLGGRSLDLPATLSRFGDLQVHPATAAPG